MLSQRLKKVVKKLPWWVNNPYTPVLLFYACWMLFVADNNLVRQYRLYSQLSELNRQKQYYLEQIETTNKALAELSSNPATQEKFAREKYRMKKDNEDVFVIVKTPQTAE